LAKYEGALGGIVDFVRNTVRNSSGLGITVPQLMYDIQAIFGPRFGIKAQDLNSSEVIEFISELLAEEKGQYGPPPEDSTSNIGLGTGTDKNDVEINQDYFRFAQPASQ